MGHIACFLRDGDRVFLTYSTTGRGNEPINGSLGLLDMTPYGRREAWEDNPEGWPEAPQADSPVGGHGSPICWYWRSDADGNATWGPTSHPVPQWTRPGATPWRPSAGTATTTDAPSSTASARCWVPVLPGVRVHGSSKCQYLSCPAHGRGGDRPSRRHFYPGSTMTDGQWALLAPLLPAAGSTDGRGGRPEKWDRRLVRDARKIWDLAVAIVKRPDQAKGLSCSTAAGSWNAPSPG
jgi:hypothetical protein